jgi:hypothetical protein
MPLRSLVIIALRMYAIYWLTCSLSQVILYIPTLLSFSGSSVVSGTFAWAFVVPIGMFLVAVIMWAVSARLSKVIVRGEETQLVFTTLTRHDFYLFAFIFLGLYFILSSIAATLQAIYHFFAFELFLPDSERKSQNLIPLIGHAFTIAAGFACIFRGRKWTNQLIALDNSYADSLQKPVPPGPS